MSEINPEDLGEAGAVTINAPADGAAIERVLACLRAIRAKHGKERNLQGEIACPACGKRVIYRIAPNGHVWGACETAGCASWVQ